MQKNKLNLHICGIHLLNPYKTVVSHLKSTSMPQVQQSVVLESYLENVKTQLAAIKIAKLKNNLSSNEVKAPKGVNSFLSHHIQEGRCTFRG